MFNEFGSKELYEVSLKTTDNIVINGQEYQKDEVFMFFDRINISNISGTGNTVSANGGKNNFAQIVWDNVSELEFIFEKGLISLTAMQFLSQGSSKRQAVSFKKEGINYRRFEYCFRKYSKSR
jgi:hypothetical protein